MKVKCPTCRKKNEWNDNPFRPFCSERCKLIDLGAWAADKYKIEGKIDSDDSQSIEKEINDA
ncbi:MAG: DNA gyrase inhibitor YacG [Nitrospiraceae bacterium]|jgi:endogenous inhibitor of DNA gyrase (YacG/DUF329 family)|nr:MAG: DNA gyrase inhibitor YacG [Nitrospiraceae bacterium]